MSSLTKRIRYILLTIAAAIAFLPTAAAAAPGDLDTSFGSPDANSFVNSVAVQGDGKVLIGGSFTTVRGVSRNRAARLNADGTLDTSFNPNADGNVASIAVQRDGKILIGGGFSTVGGQPRANVARLNADGTLDTSFVAGADDVVRSIAVQGDGKVLIGGDFTIVDAQPQAFVARLNADGAIDTSFGNPNTINPVYSVAVQGDGKVLMGGNFTFVSTQPRNYVARLNADGTLDTSFGNADVTGGDVTSIAVQGDGKVLISGDFTVVGGRPQAFVARLNANGTLDTSFGNPTADNAVNSVAVQGDGKVLIGGDFTFVGGQTRNRVARLNADGSLDTSFGNPEANNGVLSIAVQGDGKVLIGGDFTSVGGVARNRVARLLGTTPQVTPTSPAQASTPAGGAVVKPKNLPGKFTFNKKTRVGTTTGTVPAGVTRITQSARTGAASPTATQGFLEMAKAKRATGACAITSVRNKRTKKVIKRTYRCTIRLSKGDWAVTTTARGKAGVAAEGARRVVVR